MPDNSLIITRLALVVPLNRLFDYSVPAGMSTPTPGCRVEVRFAGRKKIGWVVEISDSTDVPKGKLLGLENIIDTQPPWNPALWQLMIWCWAYYHHPPGEILATALPPLLRGPSPAVAPLSESWRLTGVGLAQDQEKLLKRAPRQTALLQAFAQPASAASLAVHFENSDWRSVLRKLIAKGWLEECPAAAAVNLEAKDGPQLNSEQQQAVTGISLNLGHYATHLLYGVTGSGKTEVYLQLAKQVLKRKQQVLFLVPEIGLVPQLQRRVRQRLGLEPALVHSAQSDGERYRAWYRASSGEARVVIGTRSALFSALPELGLIVVDEEHDNAYKQQDHWRYHARDVAVKRASLENCPLVLGSATPALESLANAETGRYQLFRLNQRVNQRKMPDWQLLEMREQAVVDGLLPETLELLADNVERGLQSLVFLNRRGYAPVLMCRWCGWQADCDRCDSPMTWHHRANHLACHRCDSRRPVPQRCPACDSLDLHPLGEGTERVADYLQTQFPQTPVIRFDRDSTRRKNAAADILTTVGKGEACILVGTQMLAKGHHLPRVSLAVILNIDQSLFSTDFRAIEKLAQLLTQVSGRAGRGDEPGRVVLQTYHPQHAQLQQLISGGYFSLAETMLRERAEAGLPPYSYQAILRAESNQQGELTRALSQLTTYAESLAAQLNEDSQGLSGAEQLLVLGPMPALQARRAGRHRMILLFQSHRRPLLHWLVKQISVGLERLPGSRKIRWAIDIDPQDQ
ncbi:MAG: primosomal protein N' [Xanthomonadales bacterium]|nr:primosomal protein N' [Xanthomonadales bacterium]